ncbi:hypothetical protein DPMN_074039 [Dreissena polymorpha]|uniref:Uncharacterized protein n=1 Tax=Dreissena polymorpha TaxID=45954 RepID=A0A9D3YGX4_DREPO|nr:hypothetical protein DPMN_074039 [Dreissena polymorpha]
MDSLNRWISNISSIECRRRGICERQRLTMAGRGNANSHPVHKRDGEAFTHAENTNN